MITFKELGENCLIEQFSGNVDAKEFVLMKKDQLKSTDYFNVRCIMMDLRKANVTITKKKLKQFFDWLVRNKAIIENKSIAILTRTMDQLRFGFQFKDQMTQHSVAVQIAQFSSKQEAYIWLNEGQK